MADVIVGVNFKFLLFTVISDLQMSEHDHQTLDDSHGKVADEQNNSSEEELEVIINGNGGQVSFSQTPGDFSDTGDEEEGVLFEVNAMTAGENTVDLNAVKRTEDQLLTDNANRDEELSHEDCDDSDIEKREKLTGVEPQAPTFRRPSTAEKRKRPIDPDEEVCVKIRNCGYLLCCCTLELMICICSLSRVNC